eukprot:SAG11_NODE_301_length_11038_cov_2.312826_3_plen_266_part_00
MKSEDGTAVEAALKHYESWPKDVEQQRELLKNRLEELVISTRMNLSTLSSSDDYTSIVAALVNTETLDGQLSAERKELDSRRRDLLDKAKIEMQSLSTRESASAYEITAALEKYADYPAEIRDERDGLRAKQALVISAIKDSLRRVKDTNDVEAIDAALAEVAGLVATTEPQEAVSKADRVDAQHKAEGQSEKDARTNILADALKDVIAELEEHKKDLAESIRKQLKDADKLGVCEPHIFIALTYPSQHLIVRCYGRGRSYPATH